MFAALVSVACPLRRFYFYFFFFDGKPRHNEIFALASNTGFSIFTVFESQ